MHPLIAAALDEAAALAGDRGWQLPGEATVREAEQVLRLTQSRWPAPALQAEPDGALTLAWDGGERGWVELRVDGGGQLTHSAVIEGDEYGQAEAWADVALPDHLPDWAAEVLRRLYLTLQ
ncbi:MAG: hypothetical protein RL375_960 [Pseudomonadota bacterium]